MPHNCCVPLCCNSGYRVRPDGGEITYHSLPTIEDLRCLFFHRCCFDFQLVFLQTVKLMAIAPEQPIIIARASLPNKSEKIHNSLPRSKDLEFLSC